MSVVLWKDIWWIKGIVLAIVALVCCFSYKLLVTIITFLEYRKWRKVDYNAKVDLTSSSSCEVKPNPLSSATTGNENVPCRQCHLHGCQQKSALPATTKVPENLTYDDQLSRVPEDVDTEQFYDLAHHGINFYSDNASLSSRQRRPRMHSTVSEASLASMVRHGQRQGPTVLNPPAFPKMDGNLYGNFKNASSTERQFCSGDMGLPKPRNTSRLSESRLSTVMEEDVSGMISNKRNQNHQNVCFANYELKSGTKAPRDDNYNKHREKAFTEGHKSEEQLLDRSMNIISKNGCGKCATKTCSTNCMVMNRCPSLVTEKNMNASPISGNFDCPTCGSRIPSMCKLCGSLRLPQRGIGEVKKSDYEGNNIAIDGSEDFPVIQEEFIDDNFEDMESIVSEEVIDSQD